MLSWLRHQFRQCVLPDERVPSLMLHYPVFPADKPVEMVELMFRLVQRFLGEATLGFDYIGHTSYSSLIPSRILLQ